MTRVKICCIKSVEEARLAIRVGASAVGLVSEMPSGPGVISEPLIGTILETVPPPIGRFLLTSRTDAQGIIEQQQRCGANTLQLCDEVSPVVHGELRAALPGVSIVQVVHVTGGESVAVALRVGLGVDAILLDSGNTGLPVKELGGTARTHDWSVSARIVKETHVPVFLAGGLNSSNVGEAIQLVHPFGVDACSGVRTNGALDQEKILAFMRAVEAAG